MQLIDPRGLPTGAANEAAHLAVCEGIEHLLGAQAGTARWFERALEHDPDCALAWAALARHHQAMGEGASARAAIARALALIDSTDSPVSERWPTRVRSVVSIFDRLIAGEPARAFERIQAHLKQWPRDALAMAPAAGVFGLFGFSGQPGREAALLEFLQRYQPHCASDWWYQSALAFALCETGQLAPARVQIERSLQGRPQSANGAHIRTHVAYETGEQAESLNWLLRWLEDYPRDGLMHCHLGWHLALSALHCGDLDGAWTHYRSYVAPGVAWGPSLNLLTDSVSFLLRLQWAGASVPVQAWAEVGALAERFPASPGVSFADIHAVCSHAMTGRHDRLRGVAEAPQPLPGTAGDLVQAMARGFLALSEDRPEGALDHWQIVLEQNARLGGSRAQRELIAGWVNEVRGRLGRPPVSESHVRPISPGTES
jgi:tetratricopeptide (TPR) repeat protein